MTKPRLSPTLAYKCADLLDIVGHSRVAGWRDISHALGRDAPDALTASLSLGWLMVDGDGCYSPTPRGTRAGEDGNIRQTMRWMLLDYVETHSPPWVQLASNGRRNLLRHTDPEIRQIFIDSGLAHGTSSETVTFWDSLAALARGQKDSTLTEIGREGERLTIRYEHKRTGIEPRWVALESNSDGYDVLSLQTLESGTLRLMIEVKTTKYRNGFFHVSRNEWDVAGNAMHHAFHLWNLSSVTPRLAIIDAAAMVKHVPVDSGNGGWESVKIPFASFEALFKDIPQT